MRLFPYQEVGADFLRSRPSALLFDAPGLGKTAQAIAATGREEAVLVVCPAVMKGAWQEEFSRWQTRDSQILSGRGSFRWPAPGEVVIVNPEILAPSPREVADLRRAIADAERPPEELLDVKRRGDPVKLREKLAALEELRRGVAFLRPPRGMVLIVDECHSARSNKTAQTKRLRWIVTETRKAGGRTYGLTGTPVLTRPLDLWSILTTFKLHTQAFGGWWPFVYAFGGQKGPFGFVWGTPRDATVATALRRVSLRRRYEDVATDVPPYLPPQRILVELTADAKRACDEAAGVFERLGLFAEGATIEQLEAAESALGFERVSRLRVALAKAKIPTMLALVAQAEDEEEPLVVAAASLAPIEALVNGTAHRRAIHGAVPSAERSRIVEEFQAGKVPTVGLTIRAGGVGITLHRAARMLRVDREWTPALNAQAAARLRRTGQTRPVLVQDLVCDHVLDRRLDELLTMRERLEQAVDASAGAA